MIPVRAIGWIVFLSISIHGLTVRAQEETGEDNGNVYQLEDVVVTAPSIIEGNTIDRNAIQKTVVTQDQISDLNAQDLTSALRRVPGVVISRHNPIGSFGGGEGGSIFIRGHGGSRPGAEIQTLIDGIPKFVSVWTHPLMDVLNVDVIERLEVYKGAQPVLFGNMAFGAIDIQTIRKSTPGFSTQVRGAWGAFDTLIGTVKHGGKIDALDYYLVGGYKESSGHRDNSDGALQDYFGRMGYTLSANWDISLTLMHTRNRADDPGEKTGTLSDGRFKTEDYFTVATLSNTFANASGTIKVYNDQGDIDWVNQDEIIGKDTLTDYRNYGVRLRETIVPWAGGEILTGIDVDHIGGEAELRNPAGSDQYFPKETFRIYSPYMAVNHRFGSKDRFYFIPSAGIRYLVHNTFENEAAPQTGLTIGYGPTEFHAFYARGINYPGIYAKVQEDLFLPGENDWEDLNAETVRHFEAGISYSFNRFEKIELTGFYDDVQDRIVVSPPPPFPPVLTNVGEYVLKGIEAGLTLAPMPEVTVFTGAAYMHSDMDGIPYVPNWTFSSGLNYQFYRNWKLSMDALFVEDQRVTSRGRTEGAVSTDEVDAYFLVNAKISTLLCPDKDYEWEVFVAGENLTDTDYEQKKGYPMPGINAMIGTVVTF